MVVRLSHAYLTRILPRLVQVSDKFLVTIIQDLVVITLQEASF